MQRGTANNARHKTVWSASTTRRRTSVGHADDNGAAVQVSHAVNQCLHARDEGLATLKAKALGSRVPTQAGSVCMPWHMERGQCAAGARRCKEQRQEGGRGRGEIQSTVYGGYTAGGQSCRAARTTSNARGKGWRTYGPDKRVCVCVTCLLHACNSCICAIELAAHSLVCQERFKHVAPSQTVQGVQLLAQRERFLCMQESTRAHIHKRRVTRGAGEKVIMRSGEVWER
jgi:hypothetical protein